MDGGQVYEYIYVSILAETERLCFVAIFNEVISSNSDAHDLRKETLKQQYDTVRCETYILVNYTDLYLAENQNIELNIVNNIYIGEKEDNQFSCYAVWESQTQQRISIYFHGLETKEQLVLEAGRLFIETMEDS